MKMKSSEQKPVRMQVNTEVKAGDGCHLNYCGSNHNHRPVRMQVATQVGAGAGCQPWCDNHNHRPVRLRL